MFTTYRTSVGCLIYEAGESSESAKMGMAFLANQVAQLERK